MTANTLQDIQINLKKHLGDGIAICIDELWRWLNPASRLCNDLLQLQRRFSDAKKDFEKGTIDYRTEYEKVRNQVHDGLSTLIDSLRIEDLRMLKSGPLFDALKALDVDEDKASRPVYLVNCNRTDPRKSYKKSARELRNPPLQFCLVKACPHQMPQSFVERLLLEELERHDDDPDANFYFKRRDEIRPLVKGLPVDDDPDDAFAKFKREFKQHFSDYANSRSTFSKAAFAFALHESGWNPELPNYLDLILEWHAAEARQHQNHQILFFLVLYLPSIHELPAPDDHRLVKALEPLRKKYPGNTISITGLPPVPRAEVEAWLQEVAKAGVAQNAAFVLDAFDAYVRETAPNRYKPNLYDMLDVEFLQQAVQRLTL